MTAVRERVRTGTTRVPAGRRFDGAVAAGCLLLAVFVLCRAWADPTGRYLVDGGQDPFQWQSFFDHVAHAVVHGHNPLFTTLLNHPDGVNLAANTSTPGLSVPLAPVTLLLGPAVSYLLVLTGGLAGTAFAWYWTFSRNLVDSRVAAAVGGALCGFGPPMVSHANAHPNFVVLFVLPLIVHQVVGLLRGVTGPAPREWVRRGVSLGLLAAWQITLGGEALLLGATALAGYLLAWAALRRDAVRPALRRLPPGLGVALATCLVAAGPVLWWQFFGPQSYTSLRHGDGGLDLAALPAFAGRSLAGDPGAAATLSGYNPTEQNGFFGWPLLAVAIGVVAWRRREPQVRALAATAGLLCLLALGGHLVVAGHHTGVPLPWLVLAKLPLYDSVIASRFGLVALPALAALLALAVDRLLPVLRFGLADARAAALGGLLVLLAALAPIAPTPLATAAVPPVPALITSGDWREYVRPGRTLVPVPVPSVTDASTTRWQAAAGDGFALPAGYFLGPYGGDRTGSYGIYPRPTAQLLDAVAQTGTVPAIGADQRRAARADLRYWQADAVVLPSTAQHWAALTTTLNALLGPGRWRGDCWVWPVAG